MRDGMKATSRVMVFPVRVFTKICMAQTVQLCKGYFLKISIPWIPRDSLLLWPVSSSTRPG